MVGGVNVPEAPVELTEHGLVCKGDGWFVVNARELRWYESEGWGRFSNFGGDTVFEQLGFGITCSGRASRCRCTTGRPTRRIFSSSPARRP